VTHLYKCVTQRVSVGASMSTPSACSRVTASRARRLPAFFPRSLGFCPEIYHGTFFNRKMGKSASGEKFPTRTSNKQYASL
jgi:hypothetical protein